MPLDWTDQAARQEGQAIHAFVPLAVSRYDALLRKMRAIQCRRDKRLDVRASGFVRRPNSRRSTRELDSKCGPTVTLSRVANRHAAVDPALRLPRVACRQAAKMV